MNPFLLQASRIAQEFDSPESIRVAVRPAIEKSTRRNAALAGMPPVLLLINICNITLVQISFRDLNEEEVERTGMLVAES